MNNERPQGAIPQLPTSLSQNRKSVSQDGTQEMDFQRSVIRNWLDRAGMLEAEQAQDELTAA